MRGASLPLLLCCVFVVSDSSSYDEDTSPSWRTSVASFLGVPVTEGNAQYGRYFPEQKEPSHSLEEEDEQDNDNYDLYDDEYDDEEYYDDDDEEENDKQEDRSEQNQLQDDESSGGPESPPLENLDDQIFLEQKAEVRSLQDLPMDHLLRVKSQLQRLVSVTGNDTNWDGRATKAQLENRERTLPEKPPKAMAFSWGEKNTPPAQRRGGWHEEEHYEEDEEEDHGWLSSWSKGKKKGKGDIGSVFQIAVTFLAFLAFGGYLLCLIIYAIKGGGGYNYPYYPPPPANGGLRPAPVMMLLMTPTRLTPNRRPRPPSGRKRRRRRRRRQTTRQEEKNSWQWWAGKNRSQNRTEENGHFGAGSDFLWPTMDSDDMHRTLLIIAEGYATYYHNKYHR